MKNIVIRYLYATVGLFFVALGITLSILSNVGTAPLSCPAYVLNLKFSTISVGVFTFIFNLIYIVFQFLLFGRKFELSYLLQIVASAILGWFIDATGWMCSQILGDNIEIKALLAESIPLKAFLAVLASFFTALGISIELAAAAWMLSAELTVVAIIYRWPSLSFGTAKILMDSLLVVLSVAACYLFFGHFIGDGEFNVISWGTVLLAFLPGYLIKFTDMIVPKIR